MKRFIQNSTVFLILLFLITNINPLILLWTGKYKDTVEGARIYHSIKKSKQKKKTRKIILGDSVGHQLFPNSKNNDTLNSLACNQAIGMVGHFILLNNYLNAGNQIDTVFMVLNPFSFQNNLNEVYTYHYFLKPFYIDEYKSLFTKSVNKQIQKIPYADYCRVPYILTSNWAPDFTSKDSIDYTFLSPISIEYLTKIKELSVQHNFKVIILPTPTCLSKKPKVGKMHQKEIVKNNLGGEFGNYFNTIIYLDDNNFVDGMHLKKKYIQYYTDYYKNKLMK